MKQCLATLLILALCLTGCAPKEPPVPSADPGTTQSGSASETGSVYFLNFKPEQDAAYQAIANAYKEATGITVKVVTAASGTYEQTLLSEIAKREPPTIFQVNGPSGYRRFQNYCLDLSDTPLFSALTDPALAVYGEDGGVYGIPFVVEGYGLIVNTSIMDRYFALPGAKASAMEEIRSFPALKAVVEDMQARKAELQIDGVFSSTSLAPGENWRFTTHLLNVPLSYEFRERGTDTADPAATATIDFTYADRYRALFDLYLNNSVTDPKLLGSKTVVDAMAEFAFGRSAMVQNGNWGYGQIMEQQGNTVKAEDVAFLPLYMGLSGEAQQGLCVGSENFFCINRQASPEDQKASLDFLTWLYTSEEGKALVSEELGFIAPFTSFTEAEAPDNPLAREVMRYSNMDGIQNLPWDFAYTFPGQTYRDSVGAALLSYAQGREDWEDVEEAITEGWVKEKQHEGLA